MFDIFGRKRIKELEREIFILKEANNDHIDKWFKSLFHEELQAEEIKGYKDQIARLHKLLNFVTVNKAAKRRNDVLLASIACGKSTVTPVLKYLNSKGIKDPDGDDYKKSTVYDILRGATI